MKKENAILTHSFQFAIAIIEYCELLEESKKCVIARQLLKSGTSISANVHEAQSAESNIDFIHKLKIAAKEAEETKYWLLLCQEAKTYPNPDVLLKKVDEILKILSSIITTTKEKINQQKQLAH